MKRTIKPRKAFTTSQLYPGFQWGEPPAGESSLVVEQIGEQLEITAAMASFASADRPSDLIHQYEMARKNKLSEKWNGGKEPPHIRFANAKSDAELIAFTRDFGPVVAKSFQYRPMRELAKSESVHCNALSERELSTYKWPTQQLIMARQDLQELRHEQTIYKAAIGLVLELVKPDQEYEVDEATRRINEIAEFIQAWPSQWERENRCQQVEPLWRIREDSLRRIMGLAAVRRGKSLPPQVDARIVISELLNVFPSRVFPNPSELNSYLSYGIRPLLYSILRREFLHGRDTEICANTQCRAFFEIGRAGQRYCNPECSRLQRQRGYWQAHGKERRKEKLASNGLNRKARK